MAAEEQSGGFHRTTIDTRVIPYLSLIPIIASDKNLPQPVGTILSEASEAESAPFDILPSALSLRNAGLSHKVFIYFAYAREGADFEDALKTMGDLIALQRHTEVTDVRDFSLEEEHEVVRVSFRELHGSPRIVPFRRRDRGVVVEVGLRFEKRQHTPAQIYLCGSPEMAMALQTEFLLGNLYPVPAVLKAGRGIDK